MGHHWSASSLLQHTDGRSQYLWWIRSLEILRLNATPRQHFIAHQETLCFHEFIDSELFGPANKKHLGCSCLGQALKVKEMSPRGLCASTGSQFLRHSDGWLDLSIVVCVRELHEVFRFCMRSSDCYSLQNPIHYGKICSRVILPLFRAPMVFQYCNKFCQNTSYADVNVVWRFFNSLLGSSLVLPFPPSTESYAGSSEEQHSAEGHPSEDDRGCVGQRSED